jgi:RNA polymerase sigma factor (TIGR02999 family)
VSARSALANSASERRSRGPKRASLQPPPSETSKFPRGKLADSSEVTQILSAIERGDPAAAAHLLSLDYDELRRLAAALIAHKQPGQTLDATALFHEAYVRLIGDWHFNCRGHFFTVATEAIRRILVERARQKWCAEKGGDSAQRFELSEADRVALPDPDPLVAVHEALALLAAEPERHPYFFPKQ